MAISSLTAQTLSCGVVAHCYSVDNELPQLRLTKSELLGLGFIKFFAKVRIIGKLSSEKGEYVLRSNNNILLLFTGMLICEVIFSSLLP